MTTALAGLTLFAASGTARAADPIDVCGLLSALSPASETQPARLVLGATTYNLVGQGTVTPPDISGRVGLLTHPILRLTGTADGANITNYRVIQVESCPTLPGTSTLGESASAIALLVRTPAAAAGSPAGSQAVCGLLIAYRPPAQEAEGVITLGINGAEQTYVLSGGGLKGPIAAPDATVLGTHVCLNGNIAPSARPPAHDVVTDYTLTPKTAVRSTSTLPATSTSGNRTALRPVAGDRVTALVVAGSTAQTAADPLNVKQCGVIRSLQPPTPGAAGSIVIGSRTFQINMSVQMFVQLGTIPTDEPRCISGPTLASQIFVSLAVGPMPETACGLVRVAVPPTANVPGGMTVGSDPELVLKVPVGGTLEIVQGATQCVAIAIDSAGDAIVSGLRAGLPSTSTGVGSAEAVSIPELTGRLFGGLALALKESVTGGIDVCGPLGFFSRATRARNSVLAMTTAGGRVEYQLVGQGDVPEDLGARSTALDPEVVRLVGRAGMGHRHCGRLHGHACHVV